MDKARPISARPPTAAQERHPWLRLRAKTLPRATATIVGKPLSLAHQADVALAPELPAGRAEPPLIMVAAQMSSAGIHIQRAGLFSRPFVAWASHDRLFCKARSKGLT
jgi:hypothetical protein